MAKLPPLKEIQLSDLPDAPSWVGRLLLTINSFMRNVWQALDKRLTLQDNLDAKIVSILVPGSDPTGSFKNPLTRPAAGVILLQAKSVDIPSNAVGIVWEQIGNDIEILRVSGLTTGELYSLKLLVI